MVFGAPHSGGHVGGLHPISMSVDEHIIAAVTMPLAGHTPAIAVILLVRRGQVLRVPDVEVAVLNQALKLQASPFCACFVLKRVF